MRARAVAAIVALSCTATVPLVATDAGARPVAHAACVHAKIGGKRKCLSRGQSCSRRYERSYERHGFTCRKHGGKYKLTFLQQQQG